MADVEDTAELIDKKQQKGNQDKVKHTKARFWMLFLFGCCTMLNACGWIQLSPLFSLCTNLYGISTMMVDLCSYSYMALYLPLNFPGVWFVDKFGLRWGVFTGILLTTIGCWVRIAINYSFTWVLVGQCIMAVG